MSLSSITKRTEELLENVLQSIQKDCEGPYPVLCEMDRNRFVEEEQSLQKQLEEVRESESNRSSWRRLALLRPSPQSATKCLRDAEEFHRRVKEDMNAKLRARLTGRSNLPPPSSSGQGPAGTLGGDARFPFVEESFEPASADITSPMNMRCSLPEPELSPLETGNEFHDGTRNSPSRSSTQRRPPPSPPLRGIALPSHSRTSTDTSSDSGGDSPRHSPPVRRPAPPPPRSPRRSRSPSRLLSDLSFPLPAPFLDPTVVPSMSNLADMGSSPSSMIANASRQASHGRHSKRGSSYVSKTNCVDIAGSTVEGMTIHNGGTKNSGAVIHKTMAPLRA